MKSNIVGKIKALLAKPKDVVIISHTNPDGDAIGSSLAFYHYLKLKGHRVQLFVPTRYPDFLAWMPGSADILIPANDKQTITASILKADVIFCLDFNSADRMDDLGKDFGDSHAMKILIDHHIGKESFCDIEFSRIDTSSTAEMVFDLIGQMGDLDLLDRDIAECLYVGIMTDTGSFSYACEHERTFIVTAALVKLGIDTEHIHRQVYDTYSEERLRLLGCCLSERLIVLKEYSTAYIALSKADLDNFHYKTGDTEGIVNYTLGIKGIVFGAMISEREKKIKISLRSKGTFDVNRIARLHFNGGGHRNAAGGDLYCTLEEAIQLFRNILPVYAAELQKQDV